MPSQELIKAIAGRHPFSLLTNEQADNIFKSSSIESFTPGTRLFDVQEVPSNLAFVVSGCFRLIVFDPVQNRNITLKKYGPGRLIGWTSILRGAGSDYTLCSDAAKVVRIDSQIFLNSCRSNKEFFDFFNNKIADQEAFFALSQHFNSIKVTDENIASSLDAYKNSLILKTISPDLLERSDVSSSLSLILSDLDNQSNWYWSTGCIDELPPWSAVSQSSTLVLQRLPLIPLRLIGIHNSLTISSGSEDVKSSSPQALVQSPIQESSSDAFSLEELGILEDDSRSLNDRYPFFFGSTPSQQVLAICQMLSVQENVPFRRDAVQKVLDDYIRRDKDYSLQLIGGLLELIGYKCLIGETSKSNLPSLDFPAVVFISNKPVLLFGRYKRKIVLADPSQRSLQEVSLHEFEHLFDDNKVSFLLPQKTDQAPSRTLTWSWFMPLVKKYRNSLVLVFAASLLAQLFGLAIPLLIQQIIDKVLTQGNLSSLNLIGGAMVVMALFQGLLMALRTYIFVDTTDRMDLTLGSSVIQKLLSLPLSYFDKRPVGELSQRLGELNTIRGFLTGTALVSTLNLVFALIYLVVMFLYSPILSLIALSTIPIYIGLVFVSSPVYKSFIRKRAVAQAKTQSHLIEVLNGIQTVKAQHFELTARWKWQDKYRSFVDQGFKSAVLGTTTGEIGKFLNTISGLLVLWFGMFLVLDGQLTLGMLIAFRIIASKVTGPLLQLSGLYQSFQGVQLSMERLSDVIDQKPELDSNTSEVGKIILPPIDGMVEFRDLVFRFRDSGPNQLDGVSIKFQAGEFIGIVGQSGSGKSTLMKLLPKLYQPRSGQVLIDGFDIDKVDLGSLRRQIGIVPQDSILFEGTIAENIALNDPNASTDSIITAAKVACAHEFIMELDQGYATPLSERGSNISGGQRQRIAIARTILANPNLLIMDEATSALDFNTERQLCENLYSWATNKTVFFITHRLSTIKNSDSIVVMNAGQVSEVGQHAQLMDQKGRYFALYQQQQAS